MPARPRGSTRRREGEHVYPSKPEPVTVYEGRLFHRGRLVEAEMGVDDDGKIVAVAKQLRGGRRIHLGESILLPSSIDLHVHFRDPGPPGEVEDLASGTLQAALGGIGAVVDMPNTVPPLTTVERLEEKGDRIASRAWVDVLPYAALIPGVDVPGLARVAAGFKLFMGPTTGDLVTPADEERRALLESVARTGLPVHVHAEDATLFGHGNPPQDTDTWDQARPMSSELSAIRSLRDHPRSLRLHICHATSPEAVVAAREIGASTEATPHHLLLAASQFGNTQQKVNPPLRPERVRQALWEEFQKGRVPILASDHAPHALARKSLPFPDAPSGLPGVEVMLPLLLEQVRRGSLELATLVQASARRPALFLGVPRGSLAPGNEADFLVVDFRARRKIEARSLHAPCGWTPYEGREAVFPQEHYLRGERIVEGGEFVPGRRARRLLPRPPGT